MTNEIFFEMVQPFLNTKYHNPKLDKELRIFENDLISIQYLVANLFRVIIKDAMDRQVVFYLKSDHKSEIISLLRSLEVVVATSNYNNLEEQKKVGDLN